MLTTNAQIGVHYLNEVQYPSKDSEQWLAYLCLSNIFQSTSYWSIDGYHVAAIVDYGRDMLWEYDKITSIDRSEVIGCAKSLHEATAREIVLEWKRTIELIEGSRNTQKGENFDKNSR